MELYTVLTSLLTLLAGIGVFLIACTMMSSNLEALGSRRLKALFARASGSKLLGVGIGTAATAIIQSSSATTVMVIGFVNAGIMTLAQAATVIFGANIGTTITGQLAALGMSGGPISVSVIFASLAGVGAFVLAFAKTDRVRKLGGITAGFGMLFAGLSMMSGAMASFSQLEEVRAALAGFTSPLLLVAAGIALTAVIQSSSAVTTMAIAMVTTGLLTLDQGIYITMGSNVGTCVTAMIAGLTSTRNARRTALLHLIFNVGGTALFFLLGQLIRLGGASLGGIFQAMFPHAPQLQLSMFHTIFNIITVLLMLPLTDLLTRLVTRLVPDGAGEGAGEGAPHFHFVDEHMLSAPPVAVQQVKREIIRMAGLAKRNFDLSCDMVCTLDLGSAEVFRANEEELDFLNRELARFIAKLLRSGLGERDRIYLSTAFHSISDLERIGDYAENIVEYAGHLRDGGEHFSPKAVEEIRQLQAMVSELYLHTMAAYRHRDPKALAAANAVEDRIDDATDRMADNHIQRLSSGACTPDVGAQYLSLSSNVERIADHLINVAKTSKSLG